MSKPLRAGPTFAVILASVSACEPASKTQPPDPAPVVITETDGTEPAPAPAPAPTTLADPTSESIDDIQLGDPASKVEAQWGPPAERTGVEESPATGDRSSTWIWPDKGLRVEMAEGPESTFSVLWITVSSPSAAKTSRGIGIGSSFEEVEQRYGEFRGQGRDEGEPEQWDDDQIIVGSIYGGTFFSFEGGQVTEIFVGAGAE